MFILTINSKISSLKFHLYNMDNKDLVVSGRFEGIGSDTGKYTLIFNGQKIVEELKLKEHIDVINTLVEKLTSLNIIKSIDDIYAVGHRVIHGGEKYSKSVIINADVVKDIESYCDYVPQHQKANLMGIEACRKFFSNTLMVAVFDTSFYQTLDSVHYLYSVPYKWYEDYGIRKYGAHGIVHSGISNSIKKILGKDKFKLISCHIGNGVSISAIKDMKCVDTSMGFTPLSGAMMGRRSGDVDPSIIPYVMEKEGKNALEILEDLNRKSGLLGLSEISGDMRDVIDKYDEENSKIVVAIDRYVQMIVDYIARYYVLLDGCDILTFTGGIGENCSLIRSKICDKLSCLGIEIDTENNNSNDVEKISSSDSKVDVYVVPKNESLFIVNEVLDVIENR